MRKAITVTAATIILGLAGATHFQDYRTEELLTILNNTPKIIAENCVSSRPDCAKVSGTLTPFKYHDGRTYFVTNKHVVEPLSYRGETATTTYSLHNTPEPGGDEGLVLRLERVHEEMDLAILSYEGRLPTLERYPLCEPTFNNKTHTFGYGRGEFKIHEEGRIASDIVYEIQGKKEYYSYTNDIVSGMSGGPLMLEERLQLCLTGINAMTLDNSYGFGIPIQHAEELYQEIIGVEQETL